MLLNLTKKLCPLMGLAMAFGCGKKINDPKTSEGETSRPRQELPGLLTLQLKTSESLSTSFQLPLNGWFQFPLKLMARDGNVTGKQVTIQYFLPNGENEFECHYKSVTSPSELSFERCDYADGTEFIPNVEELENVELPIEKDSRIQMNLMNVPGSHLIIDAVYTVEWK